MTFNKVTGWTICQSLQENTVLFSIKLKDGKFAKFPRKHMCQSLVFNKNSQNSQNTTCVGVSFIIKLQTGGTESISNCWYTCIFSCAAYNKIQAFCTIKGVYY